MKPNHANCSRDLRIDFIRGLALLIIASDHVRGNPVQNVMPISFGFSDMAEVLVFLSGFLNGLSARSTGAVPRQSSIRKSVVRCMRLYLMLLLMQGVVLLITISPIASAAVSSQIGHASQSSVAWLIDTVTLRDLNINFCVIALYLPLLIGLPFIVELYRWNALACVVCSAILYVEVLIWPDLICLPSPWDRNWIFNPFAWQFLFVLGVGLGLYREQASQWLPRSWPFLIFALAVVAVSFFLKRSTTLRPNEWWNSWNLATWTDKPTMGPLRLIHFFAAMILGIPLLNWCSVWRWQFLRPILVCGRYPLSAYCAGGIAAVLGTGYLARHGATITSVMGVNLFSWGMTLGAAYLSVGWKKWKTWSRGCVD